MTTSSGSTRETPSSSSSDAGSTAAARSIGARPPRLGRGYEFTWLVTTAMSLASSRSMLVPFGTTLRNSTWFFSHEPFWPEAMGSQ